MDDLMGKIENLMTGSTPDAERTGNKTIGTVLAHHLNHPLQHVKQRLLKVLLKTFTLGFHLKLKVRNHFV